MTMRKPAGTTRQREAAQRDDERTRGRRVERRHNNQPAQREGGAGRNKRTRRGDATTSWQDKVTRGRRDERQHNLVVFRVQTESTGKVAAMVVAQIERKPENYCV